MEPFTKLGVMDFDQSLDSPNEYKNNFWTNNSSESGYESERISISCTPDSTDFNSLSSAEPSLPTLPNEDAVFSHVEERISNNVEQCDHCDNTPVRYKTRTVDGNCSNRKLTFDTEQMDITGSGNGICGSSPGVESPTKVMKSETIQEELRVKSDCHTIPRNDSIIEDSAISFDELNPPDDIRVLLRRPGIDCPDSSHRKVSQCQKTVQGGKNLTKTRCPCKRQPTKKESCLYKGTGMDRGWIRIESRLDGHFISECSGLHQGFQFMPGDRVISISEEDVHTLHHHDVMQRINDVIQMETKQSLVIERHIHGEVGEEYFKIVKYEIHLEFLEEDGGTTIIDTTARVITKFVRRFPEIYNLEFKGNQKCWILHYTGNTDKYLCPRTEHPEKPILEHISSSEDPKFQFSLGTYHGFRRDGTQNVNQYLFTLKSKDTDGCLSVGTKGNVKLKRYDCDAEQMTSIVHPIPYMFKPHLRQDGSYMLESLNHEDWFLRWNTKEKIMDIQEIDDVRDKSPFVFSICTDTARIIM